ncbi:hypothetical protein [Sphaerisporangium perillae]|uniref:hypothetical protein n=1 Tax=Sphaerisporangium perillae TaxID=2935860 RepID=UPI00200FFDE7|nr:hypothetical protein [Sphaerisporangium perillae]
MTSTTHHPAETDCPGNPRRSGWRPFVRHFLEMVVTMTVGMVALHSLWQCMLGLMLWRRDEYSHAHHAAAHGSAR